MYQKDCCLNAWLISEKKFLRLAEGRQNCGRGWYKIVVIVCQVKVSYHYACQNGCGHVHFLKNIFYDGRYLIMEEGYPPPTPILWTSLITYTKVSTSIFGHKSMWYLFWVLYKPQKQNEKTSWCIILVLFLDLRIDTKNYITIVTLLPKYVVSHLSAEIWNVYT